MSHPLMFDEDDPILARVRELALALPEAAEKISHGHPAFFTRKVFAYYGASIKLAPGDHEQHPQSLVVQCHPEDREALRQRADGFAPAYLGPHGWTGVDLGPATDWAEVSELLTESYRLTAPAGLARTLDRSD